MARRAVLVWAAVALAGWLAACGAVEVAPTDTPSPPSAAPTATSQPTPASTPTPHPAATTVPQPTSTPTVQTPESTSTPTSPPSATAGPQPTPTPPTQTSEPPTSTPPPSAAATPQPTPTVPAVAVSLPPVGDDCAGYSSAKREEFDGWASGVRDAVAEEEGYGSPPSGYHLDHNVPIADAWRSGGCTWSISRWREFYNDTGNLNYLPASVNLSKSDSGPADWDFDCMTISQWIATKMKWGLHSDARERTALEGSVQECDGLTVGTGGAGADPTPTPSTDEGSWRRSYEENCNGRWEDTGEPGYFGRCYE